MATVTLILGYCCLGRTHLADEIVKTRGVKKCDEGFLKDMAQHAQLIEALRNNIDCVVVEIEYCLEQPRQSIVEMLKRQAPGVTVKLEFFEANLQKANENCRRGNHKGDPEGHMMDKHTPNWLWLQDSSRRDTTGDISNSRMRSIIT